MTQKQRSAATQRKLLDAATMVLIHQGYADLTTTKVCKEAGVSQGALFKHFASKMDLLAALAEDVYAGLAREFEMLFENHSLKDDIIHHSIQSLWTVFSSEKQLASYDLTIAARTDPMLHSILDPIVQQHRDRIQKIAEQIYVKINMEKNEFFALADFVLMAVQGAVINSLALPEPDTIKKRLRYIERTAKQLAGQAP